MIATSSSYGKDVDCSEKNPVTDYDLVTTKCDDYHHDNYVCKEASWGGCTNSKDTCKENSNSSGTDAYVVPETSTKELTTTV